MNTTETVDQLERLLEDEHGLWCNSKHANTGAPCTGYARWILYVPTPACNGPRRMLTTLWCDARYAYYAAGESNHNHFCPCHTGVRREDHWRVVPL